MLSTDTMPLILGAGIIAVILVAFFAARGGEGKPKAVAEGAAPSKSSKKKKKKSKSKGASAASKARDVVADEPKAAQQEEAREEANAAEESEEEPAAPAGAAKKKKKKKPKKKKANATASSENTPANGNADRHVSFSGDGDEDSDDDDDFDLLAIQSAKTRKGANDAAKRAAANKERDRQRALRKQEEKKAAEEAAAAAERARAEEEAAAALAQAEMERAAMEELASKAGAGASVLANGGGDAPAAAGEKKKRKRKKKKKAGDVAGASPATSSAAPKQATPSEEVWEVVPQVEEWQEVGSKRAKAKAREIANAAVSGDHAAQAVADLLSDEPAAVEDNETSVVLPAGDDPLIFIGKAGATIQMLQDTSGAKFNLNRQTNVLTISGPEACVQIGLAEARAILAAEAERKANEIEESVTWGSDAIKAVIGRGGTNIRATQEATGVKIDADVEAGTLVISGPSEMVSTALTMCHNAAFGEVQDQLELGSRNAVNVIYGPGFQTIRQLQESTGCKLDIARGTTTLKLAGSTEAVAEATERIRALLEANRGFEMTIENSKVGAVYGKGGETLRSIQDRTGTQIDVSRGPTHATVSVMGTVDASQRARNMLQRAIDGEVELKPGEVAEEIELGSATAAIIGRGGSNVADLEKRHGVKVNVRSELQKARVVGKPDRVAKAVEEIAKVVKPILDAEQAQREANLVMESGESAWQVSPDDDDADGW